MTTHYGEKAEAKEHEEKEGVAAVGTEAEVAKAVTAEEKAAKEAEELAGKETVRGKISRLVRELRSGQLFGAERKAAWVALEEVVGWLKGEETVGEVLKERRAAEEKGMKSEARGEKAGKF
jgi:hypothetical protein